MLSSEFLQVYPREMTDHQIHRGADIPVVQAAQKYSYNYGLMAHAALRGEYELIPPLLPVVQAYESTTDRHFVEDTLLNTPGGWDYRNEINFAFLNVHMRDMWTPLLAGGWPKGLDRYRTIDIAMNSLAIDGLLHFTAREHFIRKEGTEALYTHGADPFFERFTGALQEIDVAIVALEVIRKNPNLTVVPAPIQFESSQSGANADLLVVDVTENRAVGVQTKTTVRHQTLQKYDHSRIALVDGTVDLGNVRVVRIKKGRSLEAPKPWPGIVAASRVDAIKLHGKNQHVPPEFIPRFLRNKMLAREMVGNLRVDHRELAKLVGDRIMNKL